MSSDLGELQLTAVAAMASNRVIGRDGALPWHHPDDLRAFKKRTLGHTVLMGRHTWETLPVRPLPKRRNLVLSRTLREEDAPGAEIVRSADGLAPMLQGRGEVFVIGGAEVYASLLPRCQRLILTYIPHPVDGDTFFPPFEDQFTLAGVIERHADFEIRDYSRTG